MKLEVRIHVKEALLKGPARRKLAFANPRERSKLADTPDGGRGQFDADQLGSEKRAWAISPC